MHYIGVTGTYDKTPNYVCISRKKRQVLNTLIYIFNLRGYRRKELRVLNQTKLDTYYFVNDYAGIIECDCNNIRNHEVNYKFGR